MSREKLTIDKKILGARFKTIRTAQKLTQQAFAKALGISSGFISEIEQGNKLPGSEILYSLKRVFNVDIDDFLSGEGPMLREGQQPSTMDIKDVPLYNVKAWLDEFWANASDKQKAWLEVEVERCFPEYKAWLSKKQGMDASKDEGPGDKSDLPPLTGGARLL